MAAINISLHKMTTAGNTGCDIVA